jgi:hypothetical protein
MVVSIIGSLFAKRQIGMSERHNLHLIPFFFLTPKRPSQVKKIEMVDKPIPVNYLNHAKTSVIGLNWS